MLCDVSLGQSRLASDLPILQSLDSAVRLRPLLRWHILHACDRGERLYSRRLWSVQGAPVCRWTQYAPELYVCVYSTWARPPRTSSGARRATPSPLQPRYRPSDASISYQPESPLIGTALCGHIVIISLTFRNYRSPNILVFCGELSARRGLVEFARLMKKGHGLLMFGNVTVYDSLETDVIFNHCTNIPLSSVEKYRIHHYQCHLLLFNVVRIGVPQSSPCWSTRTLVTP